MIPRIVAALAVLVIAMDVAASQTEFVTTLVPKLSHSGVINSLVISPDGKFAASAGRDLTIKIWQLSSGRLLRSLVGHQKGLSRWGHVAVAISSDSRTIVSTGSDGTIRAWDAATGSMKIHAASDENDPQWTSIATSPVSSLMAVCAYDRVELWSLPLGRRLATNEIKDFNDCKLEFSKDGRELLVSGNAVSLLEVGSGQSLADISDRLPASTRELVKNASAAAFQADNQNLLLLQSEESRTTLRLIRRGTGSVLRSADVPRCFRVEHISRQGLVVLVSSGEKWDQPEECKSAPLAVELWTLSPSSLDKRSIKMSTAPSGIGLSQDGGLMMIARPADFNSRPIWNDDAKDSILEMWEPPSGKFIRRIETLQTSIEFLEFSPDGKRLLANTHGRAMLWDLSSGKMERMLGGNQETVYGARFTDKAERIVARTTAEPYSDLDVWKPDLDYAGARSDLELGSPALWEASSGRRGSLPLFRDENILWNLGQDSEWTTTVSRAQNVLRIWNPKGQLWRSVHVPLSDLEESNYRYSKVIALSRRLKWAAFIIKGDILVWDLVNDRLLRRMAASAGSTMDAVAFSTDGTWIAYSNSHDWTEIRNVATNALVRRVQGFGGDYAGLSFSENNRYLRVLRIRGAKIYDTRNWQAVDSGAWASGTGVSWRFFDNDALSVRSVFHRRGTITHTVAATPRENSRPILELNTSGRSKIAYHPASKRLAVGDANRISLWSTSGAPRIGPLNGHLTEVTALAFSPQGDLLASGSDDGTIRIWKTATGRPLLTMVAGSNGDWFAATPEGFFTGSRGGADLLSVVRGLEGFSALQFWHRLYRPSLVHESLRDDPKEEYRKAVNELTWKTIFESGYAPALEMIGNYQTDVIGQTVRAAVLLKDQGGGIGRRVEWWVDEQLKGVTIAPEIQSGGQNSVRVEHVFKVDPGMHHQVEVITYNRKGLFASEPLRFTVNQFGAQLDDPARMYVLAIGITKYAKPDWRLNLAATDATSFAEAMVKVGQGLFKSVKSKVVIDEEARADRIERAFKEIASDPDLKPNDVFVLYLAGHGRYNGERYFFIPQDFNDDPPPLGKGHKIREHAIDQDTLQRLIASIEVNKRIVIVDTCESGEGAINLIRALQSDRVTAMEELQRATGDNLIAAAGQAAFESNKLGHGLLTYAVLEAFTKKTGSMDERVTFDMVASHAMQRVPNLSLEIFQREQWPVRKLSAGKPIPIGFRRIEFKPVLAVEPLYRDYVLVREETVRVRPELTALGPVPMTLPAPMLVNILAYNEKQDWVRIQWGETGAGVGWVPKAAVAKPHSLPKPTSPTQPIARNLILVRDENVRIRPEPNALGENPRRLLAPTLLDVLGYNEKTDWTQTEWGWIPTEAIRKPQVAREP